MDEAHEEQLKKKKRLVLLLLLALLAVTAGAAALIEQAPSPTVAALVTSPSPPTANTFTTTPQVQGDEWLQPTLSGFANAETDTPQTATAAAIASENDNVASSPDSTPTVESQQQSEVGFTPTQSISTPSPLSTRTWRATPDLGVNPTALNLSQARTPLAGVSSSADLNESDVSFTATPGQENDVPVNTSQVPTIPTEISRRINESWDVLNGSYSSTAEVEDAALSETMVVMPPDGLPVTGTLARRGMNWGAVAVVVLLLGAGLAALLYPRPDHR